MAEPKVETPVEIKPEFTSADYIKKANETEAARRAGKAVEPAAAATVATTEVAKPGEGERLSRSEKRRENRLREELGETRGKLELLQEQVATLLRGKPAETVTETLKASEDPEPKRGDFANDAEYNRAMGRWDSRQETKKELDKRDATVANAQAIEDLKAEIADADAKAQEDKKLIPDWDEVAAAAEEDEDQPKFKAQDHPLFMRMLATSDVKAFMLHHLALNPKEAQKLLDLSPVSSDDLKTQKDKFAKQDAMFRRLEGKVEGLYTKKSDDKKVDDKKVEEKKTPTAAERDAKKAAPSETITPRGGSAPVDKPEPTLADGRTVNPAWLARANERAHARR